MDCCQDLCLVSIFGCKYVLSVFSAGRTKLQGMVSESIFNVTQTVERAGYDSVVICSYVVWIYSITNVFAIVERMAI